MTFMNNISRLIECSSQLHFVGPFQVYGSVPASKSEESLVRIPALHATVAEKDMFQCRYHFSECGDMCSVMK